MNLGEIEMLREVNTPPSVIQRVGYGSYFTPIGATALPILKLTYRTLKNKCAANFL